MVRSKATLERMRSDNYIAYLIMMHNIKTGEIFYGIFSESHPTMSLDVVVGVVMKMNASSYSWARESLLEWCREYHPEVHDFIRRDR